MRRGFTLIEVLVAVALVGLAVVSLVVASSSFTKANSVGADLSTAEFLIEQIRERTILFDYDDLLSNFDDKNYSPPINSRGEVLNDFAAFSQQITVENVSASDFQTVVADHGSDFVRISVTIILDSGEISSATWIRARY